MGAISTTSDVLDQALKTAGLDEAFDDRGMAYEDCPGCGGSKGLKLSLSRGRVQCGACGLEGPLLAYLREKANAGEWNVEPFSEAEIIPLEPRVVERNLEPIRPKPVLVEVVDIEPETPPALVSAPKVDRGRWGERIIISLLAIVFLGAGLAAAGLSGFANYQAFSAGVSDLTQAQVWGWSGVIASICSFGGFTFFWWHMSGKRRGEAIRALVFALAGAGTSVAGTTLFMMNNAQGQASEWATAEQTRVAYEDDIAEWGRQLRGIPPGTRSIDGLEAYIAGVEAVGRTHQKPYRDALNELGLARRRAELEQKIAGARDEMRQAAAMSDLTLPAQNLPAWFFALMLELFSSQGTSIAFVSLLLLYGRTAEARDLASEDFVIAI